MKIFIDLNYLPFHTVEELKSLSLQILQSYSLLDRRGHKIILSISQRVRYLDYLRDRIENTKIFLIEGDIKYSLKLFNISRPLLLDPYSPRILRESELHYFNGIIIGGIVDKTQKKRLTTGLIKNELPSIESRRIELRGSRIGVPITINGIVNLLVRAIDLDNLENAIRSAQSKRDARTRAIYEINKLRSSSCNQVFVLLENLKEWLNIDDNDFPKILAKTKYRSCLKLAK